jgi:hypothetical protein
LVLAMEDVVHRDENCESDDNEENGHFENSFR